MTSDDGDREAPSELPSLFVDTTAHVDLALGLPETRAMLETLLREYTPNSSTYVQMEFERTAVDAALFVLALSSTPSSGPEYTRELLALVDEGAVPGQPYPRPGLRALARRVVDSVWRQHGRAPSNRRTFHVLVRTLVEHMNDVRERFPRSDDTACDLLPGRQQYRRPLSCAATRATCNINSFLTDRFDNGRLMSTGLEAAPSATPSLRAGVRSRFAGSPVHVKGRERCWPIGDAIIVLEAVSAGRLLTSNVRDLEPMCAAIGVEVLSYNRQRLVAVGSLPT